MFTKEQLAKWRENGFTFDEFYDEVAVDAPHKKIQILYRTMESDGTFVALKFSIYSQQLQKKTAQVYLVSAGEKKYSLVTSMAAMLNHNTMDLEINIPLFELMSFTNPFYLTASCDSISADSPKFTLNLGDALNPKSSKSSKKTTCFCNRDFTEDELREVIVNLRKKDMSGVERYKRDPKSHKLQAGGDFILDADGKKISYELSFYEAPYGSDLKPLADRIFFLGDEKMQEGDNNFTAFTRELNKCFRNYQINTCIRKIHFLGQAYAETLMLTTSYEANPSSKVVGGDFYRGRGLIQLTNDFNYKAFYQVGGGKEPTDAQLKEFVPKVATSMKLACQGSAWYWDSINVNKYADQDDANLVSAAINRPKALTVASEIDNINHLADRRKYTDLFKTVMDYEDCKNKK